MKKIFSELSLFFYMNDHIFYCYEAYKVRCEFFDNWQRNHIVDMMFYFIDKSKSDLIIDTIELKQKKIKQNWKTNTWRWNIIKNIIKLIQFKQFAKILKQSMSIYAMFAQSESSRVHLKFVANATNERDDNAFEIFSKYQNFDNVFFKKQINVLTFH